MMLLTLLKTRRHVCWWVAGEIAALRSRQLRLGETRLLHPIHVVSGASYFTEIKYGREVVFVRKKWYTKPQVQI